MIKNLELKKYKAIYKKHFGIELSDKEALEKATRLLSLIQLLVKSKLNT